MLFHEFRHIDADHRLVGIKEEFCECFRQLGLADTRRAKEEEAAVRAVGIRQTSTASQNGFRDALDRFILTDNTLFKRIGHMQQLLALAFHHLRNRNTGCAAHHLSDFLSAYARAQQLRTAFFSLLSILFGLFRTLELFFELGQHGVLKLCELLVLSLTTVLIHLTADAVDFIAHALFTKRFALFLLPDLFEVGVLARKFFDFGFNRSETLLGGVVRFLLHRFALDL